MSTDLVISPLQRIVARCWVDAEFKTKFMADPAAVLRSEGLDVPDGLDLRVLEDHAQLVHLVIPQRPVDVSDAELEQVAGGATYTLTVKNQRPFNPGYAVFLPSPPSSGASAWQLAWRGALPGTPGAVHWGVDDKILP